MKRRRWPNLNAQDKNGALTISPTICLVLLIVEVGVWRDLEVVGVRDVVSGLFARALVSGLGQLIRGGSSRGMDDDVGILRTPFCSFAVLDEDGVGLDKCL
jgi:hypothetical protein